MANLEIKASNIYIRLSTTSTLDAIGVSGKKIVCVESSSYQAAANVSERKTQCGTITVTDTATITISGSGVAAGDLDSTSVSVQQLLDWLHDGTLLYFGYLNIVDGTLSQGEVIKQFGTCRVSSVTSNNDMGDGMSTFDFELAVTGDVSNVIPT